MSCVAEKKATSTAANAVSQGLETGSLSASSRVESRMPT
jgi:hypothetical protein